MGAPARPVRPVFVYDWGYGGSGGGRPGAAPRRWLLVGRCTLDTLDGLVPGSTADELSEAGTVPLGVALDGAAVDPSVVSACPCGPASIPSTPPSRPVILHNGQKLFTRRQGDQHLLLVRGHCIVKGPEVGFNHAVEFVLSDFLVRGVLL